MTNNEKVDKLNSKASFQNKRENTIYSGFGFRVKNRKKIERNTEGLGGINQKTAFGFKGKLNK